MAYAYSTGLDIVVDNGTLFNTGDYIVVERYGSSQCEIGQVASTGATSITLVGDLFFPHSVDSPITLINYNQYQVWRSITGVGGTYLQLGANQGFQLSQPLFSQITDPAGIASYSYKVRYANTTASFYSQFGPEMPAGGYPFSSLGSIQDRVLTLFVDTNGEFINRNSITDWTNELIGRLNRDVTDSESNLFANFLTFTPDGSEYTDMSPYDIESYLLLEYSSDGGQTFPSVISPMDSRIKAASPYSNYSYKLEGDKLFIYSQQYPSNGTNYGFPVNDIVRVWYFTQQPQLTSQSDLLPNVYRSYSDVFVDYCMMRASEQSRRLSETGSWYYKKLFTGSNLNTGSYQSIVDSVKLRIGQGNKSMALTWNAGISSY